MEITIRVRSMELHCYRLVNALKAVRGYAASGKNRPKPLAVLPLVSTALTLGASRHLRNLSFKSQIGKTRFLSWTTIFEDGWQNKNAPSQKLCCILLNRFSCSYVQHALKVFTSNTAEIDANTGGRLFILWLRLQGISSQSFSKEQQYSKFFLVRM